MTSLGLHPSLSLEDRLEAIRYVTEEMRISFRVMGASTASLISVAMGETDGYIALGDSTWDVMAGLPILSNLGVSHTIDWDRTSLGDKLRFACGSEEFLANVRELLTRVSQGPAAVAHRA